MTRRSEHPSDDPGRKRSRRHELDKHPASGSNNPSLPRRPGTGERQAERRHYTGHEPYLEEPLIPGEILYGDDPVAINSGKDAITLRVENTADRPVQIGSHFHFAEVNTALDFDRDAAWGRRLNVLSGGSMRFEPGAVEQVELIPIGGRRIVAGLRGLCGGNLDG
ncbi:urease subunit beta [Spinactinospora alkalitolerans]|uniref:Urease subunit beta n=1 Tax=Spinactinospora alkalitolerans TaxID=687207 RepID=A0A852TVA6_9ACTN|nr:urease subunit beta [Spinactinospora alkalitolerans]NYE47878.1 urease subunit beta [Spinactinospora alkalitolerans]